jgi:hypothetical protein
VGNKSVLNLVLFPCELSIVVFSELLLYPLIRSGPAASVQKVAQQVSTSSRGTLSRQVSMFLLLVSATYFHARNLIQQQQEAEAVVRRERAVN